MKTTMYDGRYETVNEEAENRAVACCLVVGLSAAAMVGVIWLLIHYLKLWLS